MIKFQLPVPFKLDREAYHVVVVGLGGTGGYLFPNLVRLVNDLNRTGRKEIIITAVDGDVIEEKNINRQNFFYPDMGKNKADLMATRHGKLFGMQLGIVKKYVEDAEMLKDILFMHKKTGHFPILVSCVDNHKTRQLIHDVYVENPGRMMWIDSGNEQFSGQVVVGYASRHLTEGETKPTDFHLPAVTEIFPEILTKESQFNSEISCDDRAVDNIQNIAANIMSATQQFIMLNAILGDDEEQGLLTHHMVEFDARSGSSITHPTTVEGLKRYYNEV